MVDSVVEKWRAKLAAAEAAAEEGGRAGEGAKTAIPGLRSRLQYERTWGADARKAYPVIRERYWK